MGTHWAVMRKEVLSRLRPVPGEIAVDCTVGYAGHAVGLLERICPGGTLVGTDMDRVALAGARGRLKRHDTTVHLVHRNFAELPEVLGEFSIPAADVILADLGVSSMQVDDPSRGISYKADGPLDMRMDQASNRPTAAEMLANLPAEDISSALRDLGDEPDHERIAQWIVNLREASGITRTDQLVRLVMDAKGVKRTARKGQWNPYGPQHPAARTFQSLRILVNGEMDNLQRLLAAAPACLAPGGRVAILTFQPGENRLVRDAFGVGLERGLYAETSGSPAAPADRERRLNPRSASARLHWAVKAG